PDGSGAPRCPSGGTAAAPRDRATGAAWRTTSAATAGHGREDAERYAPPAVTSGVSEACRSLSLRHDPGGHGGDDTLIGRSGDADESIEQLRVGADEYARLVLPHTGQDGLRSVLGGRACQLAVEELREGRLVVAVRDGGVARDRGLDAAGMHTRDLHGMPRDEHLLPYRLGEAAHGDLRRVVRRLARDAQQAEQARDVDQVTVARRDEMRKESLGAVDDSPEVDVHHALDVLELG